MREFTLQRCNLDKPCEFRIGEDELELTLEDGTIKIIYFCLFQNCSTSKPFSLGWPNVH